ncbi:MAG: hypothetical protein IH946_09315 [Bacteroidetes bacterium]|nr:hypothetical protein [Bacteroidota bacterium]
MGDKLDDLIRKNQDQFDLHQPSDGHMDRFRLKLVKEDKKKIRSFYLLSRAAGIFIVIFLAGYFYATWNNGNGELESEVISSAGYDLKDLSLELADVQFFYTSRIDELQEEIKPANEQEKQYYNELTKNLEMLDKDYQQLKEEMKINYGDDRIVSSMVSNFQIRLKMIEQYLKNINKFKKAESNDKINI